MSYVTGFLDRPQRYIGEKPTSEYIGREPRRQQICCFITSRSKKRAVKNMKYLQLEKGVIRLTNYLPKSFLVTDSEYTDRIYISGLSTESIRKRLESEKGLGILWKK